MALTTNVATTPVTHGREIHAGLNVIVDGNLGVSGTTELNGNVTLKGTIAPASGLVTYTQTYSTASATMPAATSHTITDSTGGSVSTSALAAMTGVDGAGSNAAPLTTTKDSISTLAAELVLVKADLVACKQVVNKLIDTLQALGLAG